MCHRGRREHPETDGALSSDLGETLCRTVFPQRCRAQAEGRATGQRPTKGRGGGAPQSAVCAHHDERDGASSHGRRPESAPAQGFNAEALGRRGAGSAAQCGRSRPVPHRQYESAIRKTYSKSCRRYRKAAGCAAANHKDALRNERPALGERATGTRSWAQGGRAALTAGCRRRFGRHVFYS